MMTSPRNLWVTGQHFLVSTAIQLVAFAALAEPSEFERAKAQRLFEEAMQLMQDGQYQAACPKFERSQKLAPAVGNLFNLADCYEKTGRTARAWTHFTQVADAAHKKRQPEREAVARERAKQVEMTLSFVTIKVTSPSPGMLTQCDLRDIGPHSWGRPFPVEAGRHVIRASAPGRVAWSRTIDAIGGGANAVVEVPVLAVAPTAAADRVDVAVRELDPTPPATAQPRSSRKAWALVWAGVGVVGLGFGAGMIAAAESQHSEAEEYCQGAGCNDQQGVDAMHDAKIMGDWANLPFGIGIVGLGLGATLWFMTPASGGDTPENAKTSFSVAPIGLMVKGRL
ncbi:hypothetical protein ACFL5O_10270 [Myxococcota bacterium]